MTEANVNVETKVESKVEVPAKVQAFTEKRDKFKVNPTTSPKSTEAQSSAEKSAKNDSKKEEANSQKAEKTPNPEAAESNLKKLEAEADDFLNYEGDDEVSKIKKSYAHARKELTKKSQLAANLEKQALQQKALLAKFDNLLKKDQTGNYTDWDIPPQQQKTTEPEDNSPPEPTEQEMYDNYPEWKRKNDTYLLWKAKKEIKEDLQKEDKAKNEVQKKTEYEENFKKTWEENRKIAVGMFPDLVNEDSERAKRAANVFNTNTFLNEVPNGNLIAAIVADWSLNYESLNKSKKETKTETKQNKDTIMNLPNGSSNKSEKSINKKDDIPDNIKNFKNKKLRFAVGS